jgi:RNA polymerase sigma-70 factor (ECF subfamily)
MSEPITIHKIEPGSIKVTLELPSAKAEELYHIVRLGRLREYGIIDVALPDIQSSKVERGAIQFLDDEQLTQFRLTASGRRSASVMTPTPSLSGYESEAEFITRLKAGDELAWQTLVTGEYSTRLYNHLRHKLPNHQAVEDVLHDTFAAAVQAIPNFDNRVKLSTFLFSLAQHKLADFWWHYPETVELTETGVGPGLSQESIEFVETLQQLKEEHRQVLFLRYHVGLGVDEIASILGKTYRGAESLMSRARAELLVAMAYRSNK